MAESPRMCRFLHLPLQSGDDSVLRAMNRRYSAGDYRSFVQYATQLMPSLALGTDIITGFPGEDSRAFERTLELVRSLPFSNIHVFPFSARPGTQAAGMPGQVPWRIRRERASIITAEAKAKRAAYAEGFVGRTVEVLVERVAGDHARGWSGEYLETTVHHPGLKKGELVRVRVTSVEGASLRGNIPPTRCAGCLE
jgi:threonylcarbamoyladenosine tRNA methylthiotransferase MtaB